MGNDLHLSNTCNGLYQVCSQQQNQYQQTQQIIIKKNRPKSTQDIKHKITKYIQQNRLHLYPLTQKKLFQKLVSVDQQHLSDQILKMDQRLRQLESQIKQLKKNQKQLKTQSQNQNRLQKQNQFKTYKQKVEKLNQRIQEVKQKRKKLFNEVQSLLIEDFDMILENLISSDRFNKQIKTIENLKNQKIKTDLEKFKVEQAKDDIKIVKGSKIQQSILEETNDLTDLFFKDKISGLLDQSKAKQNEEKLRKVINIEDKKLLRKKRLISQLGSQVLKSNQLLMIIPIECFSGIGVLKNNQKTELPSQVSLFQILINKIKAVNMRRGSRLGLVFLVNENFLAQFKLQIQKIAGLSNYIMDSQKNQINSKIQTNFNEDSLQNVQYHLIVFRNIWPSFDLNRKIILDSEGHELKFSSDNGDLIGFIQNSLELKQLLQKYKYVNISNINNILSQIGDAYVLGYLEYNQKIDIAIKVLKPEGQKFQLRDYFSRNENGFVSIKHLDKTKCLSQKKNVIQKQDNSDIYIKNQDFLDIQQYYIKSRIFTTQFGPLKRLLMSQISQKINHASQSPHIQFYFNLPIHSILYQKFTVFIMVDEEQEFSHIKTQDKNLKLYTNENGWIGYSRYCKQLLGLNQSQTLNEKEEMVEIDAGILHKGSQQLMRVLKQLKKVKQVGFPIILYSDFFNNIHNLQ